jgi:alkylation response protein AidB-like acyl-CoA dehydrogenase
MEDIEEFRARARQWLAANMPPALTHMHESETEESWARSRELQRMIFDGGFAGLAIPTAYGGQGLTVEHQRVFNELTALHEMPLLLNVPNLTIMAPTLMDFGTEEQKRRHIPKILRGDEVWVQFLSEPSSGSDLASAHTRATRDGDVFHIDGTKVWSSSACAADHAMILARTDRDLPKHAGLTMFLVALDQPTITINRIRQADGMARFCQEFFTDLLIPERDILGEENGGWRVASALLTHERDAVGGSSPYMSGSRALVEKSSELVELTELAGGPPALSDSRVAELVGEAIVLEEVQRHATGRTSAWVERGELPPPASAMLKLIDATHRVRLTEIAVALAGESAASDPKIHARLVMRQAQCLAGGSNEIQRNIISERLLQMPRELALDREVPFREVRTSRMAS